MASILRFIPANDFVVPANDLDAQAVQPNELYHHSEQRVSIIIVTRGKAILMENAI
jgi:hypothetical protein